MAFYCPPCEPDTKPEFGLSPAFCREHAPPRTQTAEGIRCRRCSMNTVTMAITPQEDGFRSHQLDCGTCGYSLAYTTPIE